ncbi:ankyrin repeat and IBR domain-containing protein 1 [Aplysia californica]|uniref:RBR-type E3 ubiquitin transferase n=1 Tax=Aplysia californica TaxID=6500 RepID=A0ABM0JGJ0_APLCA|nr:ankyrin repeat and IBR domain-containing protein 1 [Aplysia californica]
MGSASSKFRKHLQSGDEVQALQLYRNNGELRKALDPNCSYGDSHQHETPLHLASKHGMPTLLKTFLFSKGGNPNKTNAKKETCVHCVCMESNWQSVHVCNRRMECLNSLLKWRGATLSEGQVEKIDLGAQDEKLNTALHYAAASGLAQCVETLVQYGAPLFTENEDSLTPCDTAERNGHARIALYLESKMVFSNEEESLNEEDNVSMPPMEEYSGLRPQDLQEAKDQLLVETADMLSVPLFTAEALLRNHEWSRETLLEAWMIDPEACCEKCGVTPPSSLFSDKPQVQENLASPLPSPLHSAPTPLDAECNICANTFLIAEEPVHMTCSHRFCMECWERYLNVKIQEGDAHHITCPAYDCCMLVPVDIIEGIVSRDMALRYLQFDIKAFVDSNPDMKWCPYPGCGRAVKLPDLDTGAGHGKRNKIPSDTSRGVDCGIGHYFCWECLEESHEPCSCDNWIKWSQKIMEIKPETLDGTEQDTELAANCLWLVTNSKPCPSCKSPIQKNEGCNHMKCSKCKYDFCWVCLEQWKRHNSSTGGYFKCNRYEVVKKVEEESATLVSEAENKNKRMQELNRFVHYYTRFKNHENSYKLEEPLLKTAKDKMMKLAEAVTEIEATAQAETKFVEEAVQQLLKARRVLKCSYVYGYYLDGLGVKKSVFETMQTELEECTEILSQMVNRLYLRTPRRKIMEQANVVQRKRLEFIMAIAKGLVPPETPPAARKAKKRRKLSGEAEDEDLHRAIVASIQEVDPSNPWIKDASGRHTNVAALLEWPSDESEESEAEGSVTRELGKCHRAGCNRVRARNPRTKELHNHCSRWCMLVDKDEVQRREAEGLSEIVLDEHMELLRALEMSRLQFLRDSGLLCTTDDQTEQQANKSTQTWASRHRQRPRSNSAGQEEWSKRNKTGLSSMEELGIELQRFQELSSPTVPRGEREEPARRGSAGKSSRRHHRKLSQSSRFDESKSTVVSRVPNKSVEDLYCMEQTLKATGPAAQGQGRKSQSLTMAESTQSFPDFSGVFNSLSEMSCASPAVATCGGVGVGVGVCGEEKERTSESNCASKTLGLFGTMFGAIKDLSVSNIHASEDDKTKDFLSKDLASIFAGWDLDDISSPSCEVHNSLSEAKRQNTEQSSSEAALRQDVSGKSNIGKVASKSNKSKKKAVAECVRGDRGVFQAAGSSSSGVHTARDDFDDSGRTVRQVDQYCRRRAVGASGDKSSQVGPSLGEASLLEMAENLLQMTADVRSRMSEVDEGIRFLGVGQNSDTVSGLGREEGAGAGGRGSFGEKYQIEQCSEVISEAEENVGQEGDGGTGVGGRVGTSDEDEKTAPFSSHQKLALKMDNLEDSTVVTEDESHVNASLSSPSVGHRPGVSSSPSNGNSSCLRSIKRETAEVDLPTVQVGGSCKTPSAVELCGDTADLIVDELAIGGRRNISLEDGESPGARAACLPCEDAKTEVSDAGLHDSAIEEDKNACVPSAAGESAGALCADNTIEYSLVRKISFGELFASSCSELAPDLELQSSGAERADDGGSEDRGRWGNESFSQPTGGGGFTSSALRGEALEVNVLDDVWEDASSSLPQDEGGLPASEVDEKAVGDSDVDSVYV